jgi:hypothetical protein
MPPAINVVSAPVAPPIINVTVAPAEPPIITVLPAPVVIMPAPTNTDSSQSNTIRSRFIEVDTITFT